MNARAILLPLVLTLLAGCLVVPTPMPLDAPIDQTRQNIHSLNPGQLQPGSTTRVDVLLLLGEPDRVEQDAQLLHYHSRRSRYVAFIAGVFDSGEAFGGYTDYWLTLHFDAAGILRQVERRQDKRFGEVS